MKFIFFLVITTLTVFVTKVTTAQISNLAKVSGEPLRIQKYNKIEGSPYLENGEWLIGSLIDYHGNKFENIPLRYNAYEDALEVKKDGDILIVEKGTIITFEYTLIDPYGNKKFYVFKNGFLFSEKFSQDAYFRVLYEHENLKVLERLKIIQIKVTPASYGESDYQKFVFDDETYLLTNNRSQKIKVNQKSLSGAFPEYKSKIKGYIKSENLDLTNQIDLEKVCNYIVSIAFANR